MRTEATPPANSPSPKKSYYLEISIDGTPLQAGGYMGDTPRHFILGVTSQAVVTDSDTGSGIVVAELTAELLRARAMEDYREEPIMTANAEDQELYEAAEEVYVHDHGALFNDNLHDLEAIQGDMLFLRRLHVEPAHRGGGLGLEMIQQVLDTVPHDIAILYPRPLQFVERERDGESAALLKERYGMFDQLTERAALQKLRRYYGRLGFKRIGKKGYMFRSPSLKNRLVKHDEAALKARLSRVTMPSEKDERSLVADLQRAIADRKWGTVESIARVLQGDEPRPLPPNVMDINAARRR